MSKNLVDGGLPPRWGLRLERNTAGERRVLWFGPHHIPLADIQSIKADEVRERPVAGLLMGAYIFMIVAMILAFGVFEIGWRERFLLGTLFLSFLGVAGLYDSTTIAAQRFFEVKFNTLSQGVVTFASADAEEIRLLLAALAGQGIKS